MLSNSDAPVFLGPMTRSSLVPDPQGPDHDVKKDPTTKIGGKICC
jgi:hypothetical protein